MRSRVLAGACATAALLVGSVLAAEGFQSGTPVGKNIPGPFHPLNVTGDNAGQKFCQV
jgi:hypothetical protein